MSHAVESGHVELACPGCGKDSVQDLTRLYRDRYFICTHCSQRVAVDIDGADDAVADGQKDLNEFIRRTNKKLR
jgi:DNA-directed RNA polymerase subunit RPC12/RpoP